MSSAISKPRDRALTGQCEAGRLREQLDAMWTELLREMESVEGAVADFARLVIEAEALEPEARRFAERSANPEPEREPWGQGFLDLLTSVRRIRVGLSAAFKEAH